ncbi:hypothetical protein DOY81_002585 [Sarcophaga bullata]|nr:hypothetical protein DOY81_002585 [Sarcophaga bullata]
MRICFEQNKLCQYPKPKQQQPPPHHHYTTRLVLNIGKKHNTRNKNYVNTSQFNI